MAELRDVVRRLKLDHAVREIQRSTGVHRTIIREIREISEKQGWLSADSALPTEAEIEAARYEGTEEQTYVRLLDRYRDDFEGWVKNDYSYVVMHALIQERVNCSETTVRHIFPDWLTTRALVFMDRLN